jgi:hypothetical protein
MQPYPSVFRAIPQLMKSQNVAGRRHDLDWLRLIAIAILLFYHTAMLFNPWPWHIKNNETSASFQYWMVLLHFWRMPLLLFISGAGTFMAMGKRSPAHFARQRFKRLFIPLLVGMFVVVPPQIFYENILKYPNYLEFYKTVFEFVPYPHGSFSWHHLWFIAYLLLFSLIAIPLLKFLKSDRSSRFQSAVYSMLHRPLPLALVPAVIILATQILLRPAFPEETHDLIHDWAYFVFYFCFFAFGMISCSNHKLWEAIGRNRLQMLAISVFFLFIFYILYFDLLEIVGLPWDRKLSETAFDVTAIFVGWCCVITVIGFGQHYLNEPHPWLPKINEALYPFYILHQTAIIAIGYYVCQLDWSIGLKFFAVSLLTLLSCAGFYLLLIRPFNVMRFLFGMKRNQ